MESVNKIIKYFNNSTKVIIQDYNYINSDDYIDTVGKYVPATKAEMVNIPMGEIRVWSWENYEKENAIGFKSIKNNKVLYWKDPFECNQFLEKFLEEFCNEINLELEEGEPVTSVEPILNLLHELEAQFSEQKVLGSQYLIFDNLDLQYIAFANIANEKEICIRKIDWNNIDNAGALKKISEISLELYSFIQTCIEFLESIKTNTNEPSI